MTSEKRRVQARAGLITAAIVIGVPLVGAGIFVWPVTGVALVVLSFVFALVSAVQLLYDLILDSLEQ